MDIAEDRRTPSNELIYNEILSFRKENALELGYIKEHLSRLNGQVAKNTERSLCNEKALAVSTVKQDHTTEKQAIIENKLWGFVAKNWDTMGLGTGLIFLIGQSRGWW
jgi:hypothetical protein